MPAYRESGILLNAETAKTNGSLFGGEHGLIEETFMYVTE